jgi:hypothetical protein
MCHDCLNRIIDLLDDMEDADWPGVDVSEEEVGIFVSPPYSFPTGGVTVPGWVSDGFVQIWNDFEGKMGMQKFLAAMEPRPGKLDQLCIENPFSELEIFPGKRVPVPEYKACLDFEELAAQAWVDPLRMVLLFVCVCMFISSIVVVLRQG